MNFNKVILVGNLTRDPEVRYTQNGTAVASLGLAVNRRYKSNNEWKTEVSFFDVEVWGKQAENCCEYLQKGSSALVEGHLKQDRWEDESGNKRSKIKVVASSVQFLSKRQSSSDDSPSGGTYNGKTDDSPSGEYEDPNLPF